MSIEAARQTILQQLAKLPAEAILALARLIAEALASDDPLRVIERRSAAEAAHAASKATVTQLLKKQ